MNNLQGTYEYISKEYVLAGCKMALGLRDSTTEDPFLLDAINQGLKEARSFGTQAYIITQIEIDHTSSTPKAKLPDGFIRVVKRWPIVFVDAEGNAVPGVETGTVNANAISPDGESLGNFTTEFPTSYIPFSSPVFTGNTFYKDSPYGDAGWGGSVNIEDGYLWFSSNVIADYVKVAYLGTRFEGNSIAIPAYMELSLRYFALREWCAMMLNVTGEPKYSALMNEYSRKYPIYKKKAKVIGNRPDSLEYGLINTIYHTLV